jgi:hypothetical protein
MVQIRERLGPEKRNIVELDGNFGTDRLDPKLAILEGQGEGGLIPGKRRIVKAEEPAGHIPWGLAQNQAFGGDRDPGAAFPWARYHHIRPFLGAMQLLPHPG